MKFRDIQLNSELCAFLFLILFSLRTYSQETGYKQPEIASIHSPNATDLGKYGDVPVSLYTGTVDVSVPLYEINEGGIPLKIDLNYDTSGVRVNSVPGWVGQNWSLNAGGVITRVVRGRSADEYDVSRGLSQQAIQDQVSSTGLGHPKILDWDQGIVNGGYRLILNQGYKNALSVLNQSDWSSTENLKKILKFSMSGWYKYNEYGLTWFEGEKAWQPDLEPDFFTFNFMGHTGKFFMGQDGQWKVSSSSNLKVICNFPNDLVAPLSLPYMTDGGSNWDWSRDYPLIINNITILDDQGNRFVFGTDNSKEITFPNFFNQKRTEMVSSAWFLQSVYDKFGNQIYKFEYERGPYIGHFYLNWGASRPYLPNTTYPENNDPGQLVWSPSWDYTSIKGSGQLIQPCYLKKISTKSGLKLEFNSSVSNAMKFKADDNPIFRPDQFYNNFELPFMEYDWNYFVIRQEDYLTPIPDFNQYTSPRDANHLALLKWKKLDGIVIKDASNNVLTNIGLDYTNIPSRRLFLNNVTINTTKKYSFEYYNDHLLPNFMSSAADHFGYYNGQPFKYTASISALPFWRTFYNQRNSSAEHVKYGALKKIIYPTKGYTQFEFEPHTYSKEVDKEGNLQPLANDVMIGGLRIRQIINNDGKGNNYVKEYQYTNELGTTRSSGNLLYKPVYFAERVKSVPGLGADWLEININPFMPFVNFTGNVIEYETIIEKAGYFNSTNSASKINGYTINKFSNYSQYPDYAPVNSLIPDYNFNCPRIDRGFERGKLTEKGTYDVHNTLKTRNTYQYQSNQNLRVNAIKRHLRANAQNIFISEDAESAYQIFYTDKYLIEDKQEIFNTGSITTKIKKYSYRRYPWESGMDSYGDLFPSTMYEQTNTGGILTTYKYPFDFPDNTSQHMVTTRILPSVYKKQELVTGDPYDPDSTRLLSEQKTNYKEITAGYGDIVQVPDNILFRKGGYSDESRFKYVQYDYKGNLLEYKNENDISQCIIWDYSGLRPLAKIQNMVYNNIPANLISAINTASSPSGNETALIAALNDLRSNSSLSKSMVITFTYTPAGNISTLTDERGYKTTYAYDEFNRLINIKDMDGNIINETSYHFKP